MLIEAIYGAYAAIVCSVAYLYVRLLCQTLSDGRHTLCTSMGRLVAGITVLSVSSALFSVSRMLFFHDSLSKMPLELIALLSLMTCGWFFLAAHWFMDGTKIKYHRASSLFVWMCVGAGVSVWVGL